MRERLYVCFFIRWSVNSGRHQLASMTLLMPSGLSVECRNWMAVERFIQRILRSIFSSLHYSSPRYFTPCSFPPHQTKRFPSPNFSLCYLFFPPFFTAKKSPLLSFSSFIFCVLCHFYRSILCVCVLKYILNLRYAQFHHLPTQDFWHWRRRADSSKRFPQSNGGAWRTPPKVFFTFQFFPVMLKHQFLCLSHQFKCLSHQLNDMLRAADPHKEGSIRYRGN